MTLTQPSGVLAINTKCVRLVSFDGPKVTMMNPRCVYVRIHAAEQTKHTIVYENVRVPAKMIMDDLKHFHMQVRLLLESLYDSRPMLGAGSSSGVDIFQVFMGTGLWQDGADQQMFHRLFIPTFARCLSILVESTFMLKGFASSSPCPKGI